MHRILFIASILLALGAGCVAGEPTQKTEAEDTGMVSRTKEKMGEALKPEPVVVLPVDGNIVDYNARYKRFGEFFQDRFNGYHVGDDIEVPPEDLGPGEVQEVPVRAIADGVVDRVDWVSGYGGVMLIKHTIDGKTITAIYGHIDRDSTALRQGEAVTKGQFLANLGEGETRETDGERKHLHFALYESSAARIQGYERNAGAVNTWINPHDFFAEQGMKFDSGTRLYSEVVDPSGNKIFKLDFEMPSGWEVEYIPSLQALNLYTVSGSGTARERSQILIRYFDASDFLTLNTVTIHETTDFTIGQGNYTARRYDIEKKPGVANFADQPAWRNERHIVTDFRGSTGRTRYYVVAANPKLDKEVYEDVLASMEIL